jgi:antitoxin (DNA-binding transcriptional repressor) of toxin-antitoxin stability system
MKIIDVEDAKDQLESLVELAANGQPFLISENGELMAKVSAYRFGTDQPDAQTFIPE